MNTLKQSALALSITLAAGGVQAETKDVITMGSMWVLGMVL